MKCRYSHCPYGGEVNKDEAVKDGNRYYHPDCKQKVEMRKEMVRIATEINPNIIQNELGRVLNILLYQRELEFQYVLGALKYAKYAGIALYNAASIFRLMNNPNYIKLYQRKLERDKSNAQGLQG
jgi:hypothetical protein